MTSFSPYLGETGPGTVVDDTDAYSMGVEFYATAECWVTHLHWWQAAAGTSKSSAVRTGALWQIGASPFTSGTNLSGTQDFPATVDGWNTLPLATPVHLAGDGSGTRFKAVVCHPAGGYSAEGAYYSSGAGSVDGVFGPVVVQTTTNTTLGQNTFAVGSSMAFPTAGFNATRYWVSFTVSDTDPALGGDPPVTGALDGDLPALTGVLAGDVVLDGVLDGALPVLSGAVAGVLAVDGVLDGALPALSGVLADRVIATSGQMRPVAVTGASMRPA